MTRAVSAAFLAVTVTAVAAAHDQKQSAGKMMDHMTAGKTYTGCLERTSDGAFQLTHAMAGGTHAGAKAGDSTMKGESMKGGSMKDDGMKSAGMKSDMKEHDMKETMSEPMSASTIALSAAGVDLGKHVSHKVTVTGSDGDSMNGMSTFKVKSLKMVAASCS